VHLKKIIPSLFRKEYIDVSLNKVSRDGQITTYRIIRINWNTIEQAFYNLTIQETTESAPKAVELEAINVPLESTPEPSPEDTELEASNLTPEPSTETTKLEDELIIEQVEPSPEDTDDEQLVSLSTLEGSIDFEEVIDVYTLLPVVGFSVDDMMFIISELDTSKPTLKELIMWVNKYKRFYNGDELIITDEHVQNLNLIKKPFDKSKAQWAVFNS